MTGGGSPDTRCAWCPYVLAAGTVAMGASTAWLIVAMALALGAT